MDIINMFTEREIEMIDETLNGDSNRDDFIADMTFTLFFSKEKEDKRNYFDSEQKYQLAEEYIDYLSLKDCKNFIPLAMAFLDERDIINKVRNDKYYIELIDSKLRKFFCDVIVIDILD